MGFSTKQLVLLRRNPKSENIRTRVIRGRNFSYVEGYYAIAEANRIFGFDGWDRETVEIRCVFSRESKGIFFSAYACKVRITVRADGEKIIREGHGCGEAKGESAGEAHDLALKASETDATKRALATFGKPFGLWLYSNIKSTRESKENALSEKRIVNTEKSDQIERGVPIDKSALTFGAAKRIRDRPHLRFVSSQPCLLCSKQPSDPHHLRFAQPRALGIKVSDEFTVPLCRDHHRQLHHSGNELAWWHDIGIEPLEIAKLLWDETLEKRTALNSESEKLPVLK